MPRTRLILHVVRGLLQSPTSRRAAVIVLLSGASCGWPTAALPTEASATQKPPSPSDRYADFIAEAAERFDIPAAWIRAIMRAEIDGDAGSTSPKGAMGLMQIMPQTWAELRVHYGFGDDPYDPHDNIMAGAAYLRELFDRYGNPGFLAAYNAGLGRYEASRKGRLLPPETRAYVDKLAPDIARGEAGPSAPKSPSPSAVETPSWAQSPIFAVQPIRTWAADPAPRDRAQPVPALRDVSAIVPQAAGLFVARGGPGGAP
ncbi:lytic transglycosylase domain-containing protein [Xanthobacter autotrophicus]|uniref:lytic transglycosylase domain-containing protein n=1 Tax=Xanthobacter autotrophicus TaxID=280 RepID=UPI001E312568|nr:lytic transglycosylase domain-containing protein [Xanthobacter autotrophicus]UDQ88443.1 lytic transglycosylase domain-containing protein [Xanthobacter autotrophicus]